MTVAIIAAETLVIAGLTWALIGARVQVRETRVHETAQYLTIQQAGLGSDFQAGDGDEAARAQAGRRS